MLTPPGPGPGPGPEPGQLSDHLQTEPLAATHNTVRNLAGADRVESSVRTYRQGTILLTSPGLVRGVS